MEDWQGNFKRGYRYTEEGIQSVVLNEEETSLRMTKAKCTIIHNYDCIDVTVPDFENGGTKTFTNCNYAGSTRVCTDGGGGGPQPGPGPGGTPPGGGGGPTAPNDPDLEDNPTIEICADGSVKPKGGECPLDCGPDMVKDENGDCVKKCDPGFVKNINKECVPCPAGDCSDCPDDHFRDLCGQCTSEVINDPLFIEGRCNGIRQMLIMQSKTHKEVAGFFTSDGEMMILPNGANLYDKSYTHSQYVVGDITYYIYSEGEQMFVGYYDANGTRHDRQIAGHYHTHPYSNDPVQPSPDDKDFTQSDFVAIDNFYILSGNGIYQFDASGKIGAESQNCKTNPEPTNCE